ncbi:MAG: hypothetical protein ACI9J3_003186 [Parvicellaceae bacterium]|jgi:hypothetical protein
MEGVIEKDLLKILLQLKSDQQKQVLAYVEDLLTAARLNQRADESIKAIENGDVMSLEEFKAEAKQWLSNKRATG